MKRAPGPSTEGNPRSLSPRRDHQPISFSKWLPIFHQVLKSSPEAAKLVEQWAFYGIDLKTICFALWLYVCGSPRQAELQRRFSEATGLCTIASKMRALEADILRFLGSRVASPYLKVVRGLEFVFSDPKAEPKYSLPNLFRDLPRLLRVYGTVAEMLDHNAITSPADKKLTQSRALAWLFVYLREGLGVSEYRCASGLAEILTVAYEAARREAEPTTENTIRNRVARFRKRHPKEYLQIRAYLQNHPFPPPRELSVLVLLTPSIVTR